jgi:pyroglutamyl-peptidase
MASGRRFYSVERRGHRDGYVMRDVDNEFLGDAERRKQEGEKWIWNGLPEELLSSVAIDDVWRRWRTTLPVCALLLPRRLLTCSRTSIFE